jgi:hypothetical protein
MRIGGQKRGLAGVALVCHLLTTFGFPVPTPAHKKAAGDPFPCQSSPCGCLTAEGCWQGDCCCLTIEQKLAWAEANGIEPPAHVRPLVESRRSRPAPRKRSCCSEADHPDVPSCCAEPPEAKKPDTTDAPVRWVVGVFARTCRGEGPAGPLQSDPVIVPDPIPIVPDQPDRIGHPAPRSDRATPVPHSPPTPPPRPV